MQGLRAFRAGCVQKQHWGLLQAEGKTCEDFQDEGHYSASPDSSFSPSDGRSTSSSLFIDSLTTEGKTRVPGQRGVSGQDSRPWQGTTIKKA